MIAVPTAHLALPPAPLTGVARELVFGAYKLDGQLLLSLDVEAAVAA